MPNKSLVILMAIAALGVSSAAMARGGGGAILVTLVTPVTSFIRSREIRSCLAAGVGAGPMVRAGTLTTLSLQLIRNLCPLQR